MLLMFTCNVVNSKGGAKFNKTFFTNKYNLSFTTMMNGAAVSDNFNDIADFIVTLNTGSPVSSLSSNVSYKSCIFQCQNKT